MKLLKGLIITLLVALIFSCATTADSSVSEQESPMEEQTEGKSVKEVDVEESLYFVKVEKSYYGDGQIDTITNYFYDNDFSLLKKVQTNEQEEVLESNIKKYEDNTLVREDHYGMNNELNSYTIFTYSDNKLTEEVLYDSEDKVQSINRYEYNDGKLVTWKTLGPSEELLALTTYTYDKNGNNTDVEMKDAGGSVDGIIKKTYKKGLIVKDEVLDSKGKAEKSSEYKYKDNKLVEKLYFNNKGKILRSESYEYQEGMNVPVRINYHYKSGALEAYTLLEYDSKVITKTVLVEE